MVKPEAPPCSEDRDTCRRLRLGHGTHRRKKNEPPGRTLRGYRFDYFAASRRVLRRAKINSISPVVLPVSRAMSTADMAPSDMR